MRKWHDFFGLPGDPVVLEGIGRGNTLAVHYHELFIEEDTDVHVVEPMSPFLVNFVFECEFDVAAAHFTRVDKEQGDFIRCERLLTDNVVKNGFGLVISLCRKPALKVKYFILLPMSITEATEAGDMRLLMSFWLFQCV